MQFHIITINVNLTNFYISNIIYTYYILILLKNISYYLE